MALVRLLLVVGFLLPPALGSAQTPVPRADEPLPLDPAVRIGALDNGLRYYVRENGRPESRAELRLVVDAGSVLEEDDQRGLAHFVEHMAFNGTRNFERQELVRYLESIGMRFGPDLNAYTGFDETVYMLTIPTDREDALPTGLQILADWANGVTFDPEEIEKERGVVIEEWRGRLGAQSRVLDAQIPDLLRGSRYAERLPVGVVEVLETFPHEALIRFYNTWYRPDLMAVVAVGDFDAAEVESLIRATFSAIRPAVNPQPRPSFEVPGHSETIFHVSTDPELTATRVEVRHKLPAGRVTTVGDQRELMVERLHTSMLNTRFGEITQAPNSPFLAASSGRGGFVRSADLYSLVAVVADGGVTRGLEALLIEAERVARYGFGDDELARARANLLRSLERAHAERARTNSAAFAGMYVSHFLDGQPIPGIEFEYELAQALLPGIDLEEVNQVAKSWLTEENRVVLVSAPERDDSAPPTVAELQVAMSAVAATEITPYDSGGEAGAMLAQIPAGTPVVEEIQHPAVGVTEWRLQNGVRILLKPTDFRDDEIVMRAYALGGLSLAADEDYISASFAPEVVIASGLGDMSAIELQRALAGTAVSVAPFIGETEQGFTGTASPRDAEALFQLIHLYVMQPREDTVAVGAMMEQIEAFIANRSADPNAAFSDTLQLTLNQYHPRARPPSATLLREFDVDMAMEFYRARFHDLSGFTFVFVGNLDLPAMRELAERYLGSLPGQGEVEVWRDNGIRPPTGVVRKVVRQGIEPRALTRIIFTGPVEFTRERSHAVRTLAAVLDIRLMDVLREDLGATYGVQVSGSLSREPEERYTFGIGFGTSPERLDELVEVTFRELERLRSEGPDPDVLERVKEIQRRERETSLRQNGFWVGQLTAYDRDRRDFADILTASDLIELMTPELLREVAGQVLDSDNHIHVSLLPAAS